MAFTQIIMAPSVKIVLILSPTVFHALQVETILPHAINAQPTICSLIQLVFTVHPKFCSAKFVTRKTILVIYAILAPSETVTKRVQSVVNP
jgi:hypothetical protein